MQQLPVSKHGVSAKDVLGLHKYPLSSLSGFRVSDGILRISGLALPPDGDASRVAFQLNEGVAFTARYPLESPMVGQIYWYWPDARKSSFHIDIDLARTASSDEAYELTILFDAEDSPLAHIKNRYFIPKDLRAYENFPAAQNLQRVQRFSTIQQVAPKGYSDCRRMRALAAHYGLDLARARILDWGCGHGRVIRYFRELGPAAELHGIDIDADNIAWGQQNLAGIDFSVGPLMPPTRFDDGMFDLVFGISVMTHLTREVQIAWLKEIRRILKPGGLALLTFGGDTSVAFASRFLKQEWLATYRETGAGPDLPSKDLVGQIEDPSYYKNIKVSAPEVSKLCAPYFEVADILECMFGYQDLAVLRR